MGNYGRVAINAAIQLAKDLQLDVEDAWAIALRSCDVSSKSCPRCAFIGLVDAGYIKGRTALPRNRWRNSAFGLRAVQLRDTIYKNQPPTIPDMNKHEAWVAATKFSGQDQGVVDLVYTLFDAKPQRLLL